MANITPVLDELLRRNDARTRRSPQTLSQLTDEFLKEAYRIEGHVASFHAFLRSVRQSYLSTSLPLRRTPLSPTNSFGSERSNHQNQSAKDRKYLTDKQRDQIDAESKSTLRDLNAGIGQLADAEQVRQNTEITLAKKRRGRKGFQALGRWASGGIGESEKRSPDEELEDAKQKTIKTYRESVIWYLRRKLEEVAEMQRGMMQTRLDREIEKSKSVLYKTKGVSGVNPRDMGLDSMNGNGDGRLDGSRFGGRKPLQDDSDKKMIEQQLSPEQLQLFAQENSDMLKHYEDTLDQVRTAERSVIEIGELQTTLAQNLDIQSVNIEQLVSDQMYTTENIVGGNKQLQRATERKSTARMVFYASCGLSVFLIGWDLIF